MAHIQVTEGMPGILGLIDFRPHTGKILQSLVHTLLRGESPLSAAERELIAAYVSEKNDCFFCANGHAAAARYLYKEDAPMVDEVLNNEDVSISEKLKTLLAIAGKVQNGGKAVTEQDIAEAKSLGATDIEIHDTVLIAAAFSMYNRYVDGLASYTPTRPELYAKMGKILGHFGYIRISHDHVPEYLV
jgi:uncharacterized peroxidase-related enzyme